MKHRGKRRDNQQWVYGWYYEDQVEQGSPEGVTPCVDVYMIVTEDFEHIEVIPETVGMCTGLKDKNGKDIYEGDILDLGQTVNGVSEFTVIWDKERLGWNVQYNAIMNEPRNYEYDIADFFKIDDLTGEGVEKTGTIHD